MSNLVQISTKTAEKVRKRNINISDASDVKRLLNSIINDLRNGEIDSKSANAIGYLANIVLKTIEVGDIQKELEVLREKLSKIE